MSIVIDGGMVAVSLWLAYTLRFGQLFTDFHHAWFLFLFLPLSTVAIYGALGVYRWVIRSSNNRLYKQLLKGVILSAMSVIFIAHIVPPTMSNPRSLFAIYGIIQLMVSIGLRMLWQAIFGYGRRGEPIAIYGAGEAGQRLVTLMSADKTYRPVLCIDDSPAMRGTTLSGLPIIEGCSPKLQGELKRLEISRIVLAIPSLGRTRYQEILEQLQSFGIAIQTMPNVEELMSGQAKVGDIRDISITDILGRNEVKPNRDLMKEKVDGRNVLVTGGGGSIGSELCRQIMLLKPLQLIILDQSEANLYYITEELNKLRERSGDSTMPSFSPVLGSVLDEKRVAALMKEYRVDTVYHAAAYKHVPIVERYPSQGAQTNIFGTLTMVDQSIAHGVSDFVFVSTDKAVRPTNAMGASKRVAELVLQAKAQSMLEQSQSPATRISMVRFGNVLGSSGSVVPKFKQQIKEGGPITLTDNDVTRFFMTIPEAAQLVLQASAIANGGDVFVLDMGKPVRIADVAETMVRLYGKKLRRDTGNSDDIEILVEGLRPGEKLYEEMFITEAHKGTKVKKIFTASEQCIDWEQLTVHLKNIESALNNLDENRVRDNLLALASPAQSPELDGDSADKIARSQPEPA